MDDLTHRWKSARAAQPATTIDSTQLIQTAEKKKRSSRQAHYATILILSLTLLGLALFFIYVAPMQQTLSRIGITLMLGGLVFRIGVEVYSLDKGHRIDWQAQPDVALQQARQYYQFRKKVHGWFTILILVLYTLGFYALVPEFRLYLSPGFMWYITLSYPVIAVVLIWQIRKGVLKEMEALRELARISEGWFEN
jgi:hypothetical protein